MKDFLALGGIIAEKYVQPFCLDLNISNIVSDRFYFKVNTNWDKCQKPIFEDVLVPLEEGGGRGERYLNAIGEKYLYAI